MAIKWNISIIPVCSDQDDSTAYTQPIFTLIELKWQLYKSDIESATNEMTLQADLFHNSVMEYNFRVAARNEKGFGSPAVAQKRGSGRPLNKTCQSGMHVIQCFRIIRQEGNI
jgi:hypothetical protein